MRDAGASARGAGQVPRAASCSRISLSSVRSAIAFRSRWFSVSRSFMRGPGRFQAAVLLAPAVVRHLRHANRADRVPDALALRDQHIHLPQLGDDILGLCPFVPSVRPRPGPKAIPQGGPLSLGADQSGFDMLNPAVEQVLRCGGVQTGFFGWPDLPQIEAMRGAWIEAPDEEGRRKIAHAIKRWRCRRCLTCPLGSISAELPIGDDLQDVVKHLSVFWNVRRASKALSSLTKPRFSRVDVWCSCLSEALAIRLRASAFLHLRLESRRSRFTTCPVILHPPHAFTCRSSTHSRAPVF